MQIAQMIMQKKKSNKRVAAYEILFPIAHAALRAYTCKANYIIIIAYTTASLLSPA